MVVAVVGVGSVSVVVGISVAVVGGGSVSVVVGISVACACATSVAAGSDVTGAVADARTRVVTPSPAPAPSPSLVPAPVPAPPPAPTPTPTSGQSPQSTGQPALNSLEMPQKTSKDGWQSTLFSVVAWHTTSALAVATTAMVGWITGVSGAWMDVAGMFGPVLPVGRMEAAVVCDVAIMRMHMTVSSRTAS